MRNIIFAAAGLLCLAACTKPAPPPEPAPPQPKVESAADQVGVSTGGAVGQALNAPGNYMRGMVGNIDKAKQAVALSNKQAEERINQDPAALPGGN